MDQTANPPATGLVDEELTESIIGAFYEVYNQLDYGYLESIYAESLARELLKRGHRVEREVLIRVFYKGESVGVQRIDMLVDRRIVLEIKSTHDLSKASYRQLLSYLRGSELQVGLLLHFGPKPAFHRLICTRSPRRKTTPP
jgi:GxxExxY protein